MTEEQKFYARKSSQQKRTTVFDETRGIQGRIKFSQCEHGVRFIDDWKPTGARCSKCHPDVNESFYVPDTGEFFNYGLGCVTKGTRDAERIARKRGLEPLGKEPLPTPSHIGRKDLDWKGIL